MRTGDFLKYLDGLTLPEAEELFAQWRKVYGDESWVDVRYHDCDKTTLHIAKGGRDDK